MLKYADPRARIYMRGAKLPQQRRRATDGRRCIDDALEGSNVPRRGYSVYAVLKFRPEGGLFKVFLLYFICRLVPILDS